MKTISPLSAVSPIDGRYRNVTSQLVPFFSEYALMRYRVLVEIEYFIALCALPLPQLSDFDSNLFDELRNIYTSFSEDDAALIKEIEKTTNHDIKAVEYFVREKMDKLGMNNYTSFVHFGLTSQDINNTAIPLSILNALDEVVLPLFQEVIDKLKELSLKCKDISMLARTHGQPASPTRLGKELKVFVERLEIQKSYFDNKKHAAKFGGATGNFNAHHVAYPEIDWVDFANRFVNDTLGLCIDA